MTNCGDCQNEEYGEMYPKTHVETSHTCGRPHNRDRCNLSQDNRDDTKRHRYAKYKGKENAEEYFATKEEDGSVQFTCKICEVSFESQKDMIQHSMIKHGAHWTQCGGTWHVTLHSV